MIVKDIVFVFKKTANFTVAAAMFVSFALETNYNSGLLMNTKIISYYKRNFFIVILVWFLLRPNLS